MERKTDTSENIFFPFKAEEKKVVWPKRFILVELFVPDCLKQSLLIERTHFKALSGTGAGTCCIKAGNRLVMLNKL